MNHQTKATYLSVLIHSSVFFCLMAHGHYMPRTDLPLTVDFSISSGGSSGAAKKTDAPVGHSGGRAANRHSLAPGMPARVTQRVAAKMPAREQKKREKLRHLVPRKTGKIEMVPSKARSDVVDPANKKRPVSSADHGPKGPRTVRPHLNTSIPIGAAGPETAEVGSLSDHDGSGVPRPGKGRALYNFQYIRDIIIRNISFPSLARSLGLSGKVVVSFVVKKDGNVKNLMIVSSSGIELLDTDVIETIKRSTPFPKPPIEARIVLPIAYDFKEN